MKNRLLVSIVSLLLLVFTHAYAGAIINDQPNVIVIMTDDQGYPEGIKYFNAGMRGMKTELWDGGHRVPCFINWPEGNFKNIRKKVSGLTQVQDILPTLVELCGLKKPTPISFDGMTEKEVLEVKSGFTASVVSKLKNLTFQPKIN